MLRYKRWTFEAWYQSECTIIPSLTSWLVLYHLETYFWKDTNCKSLLRNESCLVISFHHSILQLAYITQAWIFWILELVPCKQTYEMHIQIHHTSSWACSPYLCAQNFNWSPFFVIVLHLCFSPFVTILAHYFLPIFSPHILCTNIFVYYIFSPFVIN